MTTELKYTETDVKYIFDFIKKNPKVSFEDIILPIDRKATRFKIEEAEIEDFTNENCTWTIRGEKYKFIEKFRTDGDGEFFNVVTQRKSDSRYFMFSWGIGWSQNYHYCPDWHEVSPEEIKSIKWNYVN